MDEQTVKNLLDARRRADLQVLDLISGLERFRQEPVPQVPDATEANVLMGVEDDLANGLARIRRARLDIEILSQHDERACNLCHRERIGGPRCPLR